jgi:uncharacterized protein involved in exopolysaccharide biosynthesis|tara:strand:+ start:52 stop:1395 length:1344 start_codon:yes stop_codon:yes gene_type:complete
MIKLTPHEQKILDLVKNNPDIIHDPEKRKQVAEENGLTEKTLRNRIGDLKKYGVLFPENIIDKKQTPDLIFKGNKNITDLIKSIWGWNKYIIINIVAITFISLIVSLILPKTYRSSSVLMPPTLESGSSVLGNLTDFSFNNLLSSPTDGTMSFIAILKSRTVIENVIEKFDLINFYESEDIEKAIDELSDNINIEVEEEGTIRISTMVSTNWFHPDKEEETAKILSSEIANYFVDQLMMINLKLKSEKATKNREFIEQRYYQNIEKLAEVEEKLRLFQEKNKTINLEEQTTAAVQVVTGIISNLSISKVKLSILEETHSSTHPSIKLIKSEINGLQQQLEEFDSGSNDIFIVPGFSQVPDIGMKLGRFIRDVEIQNTLFTFLTQQYEEAKIQEAKETPTVQVLDKAMIPINKYKPRRALFIISIFLLTTIINAIYIIQKINYFKITL